MTINPRLELSIIFMPHLLKIHILGEFRDGPWGGGNQFLKNLRQTWQTHEHYADHPQSADVILFNSYQQLLLAVELKRKFPSKLFMHRLGPIFHYHRGKNWEKIDRLALEVNRRIADWTIFQSKWSYRESIALGFKENRYSIIGNAPDDSIFNQKNRKTSLSEKIQLITTSWSTNPNKGLPFYQYLDDHLDLSRYKMTFIGNSSITFKNIRMISPLSSTALAEELKKHDIFIAPFKYEAASNAILEALACGLPVVALDSGSNHEEVKKGGELFQTQEELLAKIDLVAKDYHTYQNHIEVAGIREVAQQYLKVIEQIGFSRPRPPFWFYYYLKWKLK